MKALGIEVIGKDVLPTYGEMTPDVIRKSIFGDTFESQDVESELMIPRPPTFCAGCPHRGFFYELGKRKDVIVSGDIGCYALGFSEPYNAVDFSVCMGGAFGVAHGCQKALDMKPDNKKRVVGVHDKVVQRQAGAVMSVCAALVGNSSSTPVVCVCTAMRARAISCISLSTG